MSTRRSRPVIVCETCLERVRYPVDYLLGMILEHKRKTGHAEYRVTIPEKLRLKVD